MGDTATGIRQRWTERLSHGKTPVAMPLLTKRWCDERGDGDGLRLLVCRYRPRAVRKEDETWNAWRADLGPSRWLHADAYGKNGPPLPWPEYRRRYLAEMAAKTNLIDELARRVAAGETVTLLCSSACVDAARCHRSILADLVEQRAAGFASRPATPSATGRSGFPRTDECRGQARPECPGVVHAHSPRRQSP